MKKVFFWVVFLFVCQISYSFFLMIDTPGSLYAPGRVVWDSFERGIVLQLAQKIKQEAETKIPSLIVRVSDIIQKEENSPLNKAQRYNILSPDLVIFLGAYQEEKEYRLYLYHFSYQQSFMGQLPSCAFYPYQKAYMLSYSKTESIVHEAAALFAREEYHSLFELNGPYAAPICSLIGLTVPAVMIEFGILKERDEHIFVDAIVELIQSLALHKNAWAQ